MTNEDLTPLPFAMSQTDSPHRSIAASLHHSFLWGASTSAYQIEGNNTHSDLWQWERRKGWEPSGQAANSWELFEKDVACLKETGLNAYRFSVEWARINPRPGEWDRAALERYIGLVQMLKDSKITPIVCLHHFTNPAWLLERYPLGWADGRVVPHFLEFVNFISEALKKDVYWWLTFNEPNVYALQSFGTGYFPPGKRSLFTGVNRYLTKALDSLAEAHWKSYAMLKEKNAGSKIGIAQNIAAIYPFGGHKRHLEAARRWDDFFHWMFLDKTAGVSDFIGVNYYTRVFVRFVPYILRPLEAIPLYSEIEFFTGRWAGGLLGTGKGKLARDDMGHEIYPQGLCEVVLKAWQHYKKPVFITENGLAATGEALRSEFLKSHIQSLENAVGWGVPILGYLHWSLMDNYEWGTFRPRFGLYAVDRSDSFKRIAKPAVETYRQIAVQNMGK
ncbi:MAG: glycoside hydrolase family 1 protein [Elusimicrobia bacterium]|nr:glycoside hydrolase family 1 protein [Elusimicrobiota bacterium]